MILQSVSRGCVALLPVLVFLTALIYFDSFKVVRVRAILIAIAAGMLAAGGSYWIGGSIYSALDITFENFSRFVSPWIEESLKALLSDAPPLR